MENLNAEQIIKALEHCINRKDCSDCVIKSKEIRGSGCIGRPRAFLKNTLLLIKELTDENERLRAALPLWAKQCVELEERCMQLRADTVREMRERVTTFFTNDDNLKYNEVDAEYINECIDQIAKEMLEGKNVSG